MSYDQHSYENRKFLIAIKFCFIPCSKFFEPSVREVLVGGSWI